MSDYVDTALNGALGGAAGALGTAYATGTLGTVCIGGKLAIAAGGAAIGAVAVLAAPLVYYLAKEAIKFMSEGLHRVITGIVNCIQETAAALLELIWNSKPDEREKRTKHVGETFDEIGNFLKKNMHGKGEDEECTRVMMEQFKNMSTRFHACAMAG